MLVAVYIGLALQAAVTSDAVALYKQHKYAEAAQAFERSIGKAQLSPGSVLLLAQSYYLSGQFAKAIPWLEKAPPSTEVTYMLGNAFILAHQPANAVAPIALLFDVKAESAAAQLLAGQLMLHQELLDYAEQQVRRAIELDPRIPEAHYMLGVIATSHADIDAAISEFRREIGLNPNFAMAYYKLGDAYSRREQWDSAIPELQRSIWLNPNYSGPYILLGKAYLRKHDLMNAEGMLRSAIRMDPSNSVAHYLLGEALTKQGRLEEGRRMMQRSQELKQ